MKLGPRLNSLFGTAYIKNLKSSSNRLQRIVKECEAVDLQYVIVESIDGTLYCDSNYIVNHGRFTIPYPASGGFLGVHLTTEKIILEAINTGKDCVMIFDDDCVFSHTNTISSEILDGLHNELPKDWDIIILGTICAGENYSNIPITYLKCPTNAYAAGSHGIVVNKKIYNLYYQHLKEKKYWGDGIIGHFIDIGKNIYIVVPSICQQDRTLYSDINKCYHHIDELGTAIIV